MSDEGAESYYYAWRVVGAMLGVDQEHVPQDLGQARQFSDLYMTRHMGPSEEGAQLTRQLIDLYEEVVPGTLFDPVVSALIRYLIGDTCADWLQVPAHAAGTPSSKPSPHLLGVLETIEDHSPARRLGPGPPGPPHHRLRTVAPSPAAASCTTPSPSS